MICKKLICLSAFGILEKTHLLEQNQLPQGVPNIAFLENVMKFLRAPTYDTVFFYWRKPSQVFSSKFSESLTKRWGRNTYGHLLLPEPLKLYKTWFLQLLNHFTPMSHSCIPWKSQKTVFRGYINGIQVWNGLIYSTY